MNSAPPPSAPPPSAPTPDDRSLPYASRALSGQRKLWSVGTLTYTSAGLAVLFFWLLFGDFALNTRERTVGDITVVVLKQHSVSNTFMSTCMVSLPAAISLLLVPIVSAKSDRYRSRWGRRVPFLLIPTPIAAIAMVGLGFSPALASRLDRLLGVDSPGYPLCFQIVFAICWTLFEVAALTVGPILGGLINDTVPRPLLGRFFGLFRFVSLGVGMLEGWFVLKHAESHYTLIFCCIAITFGVGFAVMCFNIKEGDYPPPPPIEKTQEREPFSFDAWKVLSLIFIFLSLAVFRTAYVPWADAHFFLKLALNAFLSISISMFAAWIACMILPFTALPAAARVYVRECFREPYYLWVFAAMLLAGLTFSPFNNFSLRYATEGLGISLETYGHMKSWSYFASLLLAYPLGHLVDRFHPLRIGIVAQVLYLASVLYGSFFVRDTFTFGIAFVAHTILSGTYFTATASLGQALFPKLKFGQYASAAGQVGAIGAISLGLVLGPILDLSGRNYRLTFVMGLILCCGTIISLLVVYRRFLTLGGPANYVAPDAVIPTPGFEANPPR